MSKTVLRGWLAYQSQEYSREQIYVVGSRVVEKIGFRDTKFQMSLWRWINIAGTISR